jgi:heptosyltransferase-2
VAHLVFQTAFPGDLFLSIPLIRQIRVWDPAERLVLACRPGLGEFFVKNALVDEVIEIDKGSRHGRALSFDRLHRTDWDVIFCPHESPRTAWWMWRLRAAEKVGFSNWWNQPVFTRRVKKPAHLPDALRQLSLMAAVDDRVGELMAAVEVQELINSSERSSPHPLWTQVIPEWASMQVKTAYPVGMKIFLAPGSVWATKRWTRNGYVELARSLILRGCEVELVGSAAEKDLCDEIQRQVPGVVNRAGQTSLSRLVDLFSNGTALICNDSGAMHAAAVAGLPTVAIFGPTTLELGFRPWQERAIVVQKELKCRPCGKHGAKTCPLGTHACMEEIAAPDILEALDRLLD